MRVGLACTPAVRRAFLDAQVLPWTSGIRFHAGDILFLDAALDPTALQPIRGLLLPDVETLLVDDPSHTGPARGGPWRRLRLPRDHDDLIHLRAVQHASTFTVVDGRLRPVTIHLDVRDRPRGDAGLPAGRRADPILDAVRGAFAHSALPWPEDTALTLRWTPGHHTPDRFSSLAVAAVVLAITGTVLPAALRHHMFLGDIASDGHLPPPPRPDLSAAWEHAHSAGYRHLAASLTQPHRAVHPVARVADLIPLLRA